MSRRYRYWLLLAMRALGALVLGVTVSGCSEDAETQYGRSFSAQDDRQKVAWLRKAAEQGHVEAQLYLGGMYSLGRGAAKDDVEAAVWFRKAAEQGNAAAQSALGGMYQTGRGVPRDYAQAVEWYRKAAEQGDADAQRDLGQIYDEGDGVSQDYIEALAWYRRAAAQGGSNLGRNISSGEGLRRMTFKRSRGIAKRRNKGTRMRSAALGGCIPWGKAFQKMLWKRTNGPTSLLRVRPQIGRGSMQTFS